MIDVMRTVFRVSGDGRRVLAGLQTHAHCEEHDARAIVAAPGDRRSSSERLPCLRHGFDGDGPGRSFFANQRYLIALRVRWWRDGPAAEQQEQAGACREQEARTCA